MDFPEGAIPLMLMFQNFHGEIVTHIFTENHDPETPYGMLVCDLVAQVAATHLVSEDTVWAWIENERVFRTTLHYPPGDHDATE